MQNNQKISSVKELEKKWDGMAPVYSAMDSAMQTFYYTLVNILKIEQANSVLEIACGTGRLLPYTMSRKKRQCFYFATDLSTKMIELTKANIESYIKKMGVQGDLQNFLKRHNLRIQSANGEEIIDPNIKYDRIICNLVLMETEDPLIMLNALSKQALEGCLLGVTIWGNPKESNVMTLRSKALEHLGLPQDNARTPFHLYNKLEGVVKDTEWEIVLQWEQNTPFHVISLSSMSGFIAMMSGGNEKIKEFMTQKMEQIIKNKQTFNFPCQMAVMRKKKRYDL